MKLFAQSPEKRAERSAKKARHSKKVAERHARKEDRIADARAKLSETRAGQANREAERLGRPSPAEMAAIPLTRERFSITVTENISTAGLGTTQLMKYRWTVVDTATDVPQRTDYALTMASGHREASVYVGKLLNGKRRIK